MIQVLIGLISGIVSGMGMGGGTILIIALICFLGIDQKKAQASNLIFFVPTSIAATIQNIKNKQIKWKLAIPIAIFGVVGAVAGSYVATQINTDMLKKLFAVFLILIAIFEIKNWYKKYIK